MSTERIRDLSRRVFVISRIGIVLLLCVLFFSGHILSWQTQKEIEEVELNSKFTIVPLKFSVFFLNDCI